jgi:glutathione S-transferase
MLTLLTYPRHGDVFSLSPFCVKAALLLTYAGQAFQREDLSDPRKMPHRKLPVLLTPAGLVPDSDDIRRYLETKGTDFDPGLSSREKAHAQALTRLAEDTLYFHVVYDRWANQSVWPSIRDTYFAEIPALIRRPVTHSIRQSVCTGLAFQGTGRFSESERTERLERDLQAVTVLLKEGSFLMGDQITSADFSVAAMLQAMRATMVETSLVRRVSDDPVLSGYVDRVFHEAVPLS